MMTAAASGMQPEGMNHVLRALRGVRRRLRWLLVCEAVGRLTVVLLLICASIAAVDWLVRFPWFVRTGFLVLGASLAGLWVFRHIWRPLTSPIPLKQLVLAMEGLPPATRDLVAGALGYAEQGGEGSSQIWKRIISEADHAALQLRSSAILQGRRAAVAAGAGLAAILIVLAIARLTPWVVLTGVDRIVRPIADTEWPRSQQIEPLTRNGVVAWGETFTAQMRLARGDDPDMRCHVEWRTGSGATETAMMRRDADGVYRMTLENLREPVRYSFKAGDDSTGDRPFLLRVVKRPEVEFASISFTPPAYAAHRPELEDSLEDREAEALAGSSAILRVRPSKRITGEGHSQAEVVFDAGRSVPLVPAATGNMLEARFVAVDSGSFRIRLVDALGLEARGGPAYRLQIRPDAPPSVNLLHPESVSEATAAGTVDLSVLAEDDVGLRAVRLVGGKSGQSLETIHELLVDEVRPEDEPPLRAALEHEWRLESLRLSPGDTVEYFIEAEDGFALDGSARSPVRTAICRVHIISETRLAERLRMELLVIRDQVRGLVQSVRQARDRTGALDAGPAAQIALSADQQAEASALAGELSRLAEKSAASGRALHDLKRFAERNGAGKSSTAQQSERMARRMTSTAVRAIRQASEQLHRAGSASSSADQHDSLLASNHAQADAVEMLDAMLREMDQWDEFEDIVRRLRESLDRQEALERDVSQLARQTRGSAMSDSQVSQRELTQAGVAQGQLRAEVSQLMDSMQSWAGERRESEAVAAASIRDAAQAGKRQGVLERMDHAAGAIQTNQLSAALTAQRDAASALRVMLAALDERPERQLAELSRDLKDVTSRLRRLIESQEGLIDRNRRVRDSADAIEQLEMLSDRQASLLTTARATAGLIKTDDEEGRAARESVERAILAMGEASDLLSNADGVPAEERQNVALESLTEALAMLEELEQRVDQEMGERSLDAIVDALKEVRVKQQALRTETSEIQIRMKGGDGPNRADGLRLNRLARIQRELIELLAPIRDQVAASVVYVYLLDGIEQRMETAAARLTSRDSEGALSEQDLIIRDLGRLIDSAREERDKRDPRFVQDQNGGGEGGAGQPTANKPVPTLAELKVLRSMQVEVAEQTKSLAAQVPDALTRSEANLRRIQEVGGRQAIIRTLAAKMLEKGDSEEPSP